MPVRKDPSGNRSVEAEVVVPGTPEEVWNAIATGPGVSSWFVPTQIEERAGGAIKASFGPGMDSLSTITEWDPPHRFAAESRDDMGPDDPPVATEWTVEARDGATCTVRVVHRWFTSKDDWDAQFEQHVYGWHSFFRLLRLYLANFAGRPCSAFQVMGVAAEPKDAAWGAWMTGLGLSEPAEGRHVHASADTPPLAGVVERVGQPEHPEELLLRLVEPGPGIAHLFAMPMGGQVLLSMRIFVYGDDAAATAGREEPRWRAWMDERFALAGAESVVG